MDIKELRKQYPTMELLELKELYPEAFTAEIVQELTLATSFQKVKEQYPEAINAVIASGCTLGAANERKRIMGIMALPANRHANIINAAIADGSSTAAEVAIRILNSEKVIRA